MIHKKLRVLTVNVSDSSGGAARAAYRIHKAIVEEGVDGRFLVKDKTLNDSYVLTVKSFDSFSSFKAPFRWIKHKIRNKLQHARWHSYPNRKDVFMSDLRGINLNGTFHKIDYDILHLHWINLRFVDIKDLAKVSKPIIWTLHDCWPFTGVCHYFYDCTRYKQSCGCCPHLVSNDERDLSHKVWQKKMEIFTKLNIHVVCPSNWLAQAARESAIFKQFPVSVIPNPIDTDFFTPGSKSDACKLLNISPDKRYILYGAMNSIKDKRKGFEYLKSSLQSYENEFDSSDIEVLIFGNSEKAHIEFIHIPVTELGMLNDEELRLAYQASSLTVSPSLSENLSNVIVESLSCGTPVVAFNIGGNSDIIDHKLNGYLAKEKDIIEFAHGIKYCLDNNKNKQLSVNGRKKILDCFQKKVVGAMYMDLYKSVYKHYCYSQKS